MNGVAKTIAVWVVRGLTAAATTAFSGWLVARAERVERRKLMRFVVLRSLASTLEVWWAFPALQAAVEAHVVTTTEEIGTTLRALARDDLVRGADGGRWSITIRGLIEIGELPPEEPGRLGL